MFRTQMNFTYSFLVSESSALGHFPCQLAHPKQYTMMPTTNVPKHYWSLISLLLLHLLLVPCLSSATNITTDQVALLALKSSISDLPSNHILAKNWSLGSSVCDWIGVTCGSRHLRVTALNISYMNLTGTIPPQLGNLSFMVSLDISSNNFDGELPDEFALFRRLKVLDVSFNNLNGQFPPWITSFQELEYLSLMNNSFTGVIPPSISNMSKLTTLSASYNHLQGNIPAGIFNMSSLGRISLSANDFSAGTLPEDLCRNLPRLKRFDLQGAGLIGQIPSSIGQCLELEKLYLSSNSLTGGIPREIGNLKGLQMLELWENHLEGAIPIEIGNLSMLRIVDFTTNNLSGVVPKEISKLSNIQQINFGFNKLTGSIPVDVFNISTLISITLSGNHLSGNLPSTMCYNLPNLAGLYLGKNIIGGVIPNSIANCSNLQVIELSENVFQGSFPKSLGDLSLLKDLDLSNNNLSSDPSSFTLDFITSLANCKYLSVIEFGNNPLYGVIPDSIGNLSSTVEGIYGETGKLRGDFPSGIGNLSCLNTLDLADNQLSGLLPSSMKNLLNLQRLYLGGNNMSISLELFCAFKNLGLLGLEENYIIGGAIPDCLGNITSMRVLYLSSNGLNSSLPVSLWNLKDLLMLVLSSNSLTGSLPPEINNLKRLTLLDFSSNHFSGDIPRTIGDLENLQNLYLAHNQLEGHIPEAIGSMLSLEQLDLSYNFLSGSLPLSLEKLQDLTFFNVSFNNLRGKIPSQGPFINFTAESFISNQALCGASRFHVPPCSNRPTQHRPSGINKHKILIILVVTISIVGTACLVFVYLKYKNKGKTTIDDQESFSLFTHKRISYYELLQATNRYNQDNLLGTGSFGSVYKGVLKDGSVVAVKVFNSQLEGSFKSFDKECEVLCNLRHRNLTKVICSCSNPDFKALVLDYMPNGSLHSWLHSNKCILNVMQRLDILIDVACALQYLHVGNLTSVAHCDVKPSNVLLDEEMVAHISDFGISKLLGGEDNITYTKTLATFCYIAPGEVLFSLVYLFIYLFFMYSYEVCKFLSRLL
ncbi:OLC1v1025445C2 [Oldenlandia corymbosa var. corymbosa]|uniref:OLC1v1025445C2 n=1 Tax=Oldenlandia corymbosa var. corymbosa TaxID=529605 RepID=A0AAV1C6W2_OLDCO|nr:OLC1v1025445C2 [Oldenlandia corymbosa var. corymbosa]